MICLIDCQLHCMLFLDLVILNSYMKEQSNRAWIPDCPVSSWALMYTLLAKLLSLLYIQGISDKNPLY